mmetsp:Transcript_144127/g.401562  ORF Transcript_144127/g.401562 Transcript_144127/m.401562 type:complete len:270 (-) Transcript_144127:49-858(-)
MSDLCGAVPAQALACAPGTAPARAPHRWRGRTAAQALTLVPGRAPAWAPSPRAERGRHARPQGGAPARAPGSSLSRVPARALARAPGQSPGRAWDKALAQQLFQAAAPAQVSGQQLSRNLWWAPAQVLGHFPGRPLDQAPAQVTGWATDRILARAPSQAKAPDRVPNCQPGRARAAAAAAPVVPPPASAPLATALATRWRPPAGLRLVARSQRPGLALRQRPRWRQVGAQRVGTAPLANPPAHLRILGNSPTGALLSAFAWHTGDAVSG